MKTLKCKRRLSYPGWEALGFSATWCETVVNIKDACHYWKDATCLACRAKKPKGRK